MTRNLDLSGARLLYHWSGYDCYNYPGRWLGHPRSLPFLILAFALCGWCLLLVDVRIPCYWFLLLIFILLCVAFSTLPSYDHVPVFTSLLTLFIRDSYALLFSFSTYCWLLLIGVQTLQSSTMRSHQVRRSSTSKGAVRVVSQWYRVASSYLAQERASWDSYQTLFIHLSFIDWTFLIIDSYVLQMV